MSTIQVRVDDDLKSKADALFKELGTDTTSAIRMFLTQAVAYGGIPFKIKILFCKWVVIIRLFTVLRAHCIPVSHFFWRQNCHFNKF